MFRIETFRAQFRQPKHSSCLIAVLGMSPFEESGQELVAKGFKWPGAYLCSVLGRKHWQIILISKVMKSKASSSLGWGRNIQRYFGSTNFF